MTEQLSTAHEIIRLPFMNLTDRYLKFSIYFLHLRLRRISAIAKTKNKKPCLKNPNLIQPSHFTDLESDSEKTVPQTSYC